MLLLTPAVASVAAAASILIAATSPSIDQPNQVPASALQIIVAYGKLAGDVCYGKVAPPGSSCQLPLSDLRKELGLEAEGASLTKGELQSRINALEFQWPLKPYGINTETLVKTSVMNTGAETAYYMDALEKRGLYDRRNPTGPLPTSLRPKLNAILDKEGIDDSASNLVFEALAGDYAAKQLTGEELDRTFQGRDAIDYYGFLDLIGNKNINWPKYASDQVPR